MVNFDMKYLKQNREKQWPKRKQSFFVSSAATKRRNEFGKCPGCGAWNTFVEEVETSGKIRVLHTSFSNKKEKAVSIINIESSQEERIVTDNRELNRVLGGRSTGLPYLGWR
ncbi:putative ATP-dependent serine protease [Paenibacillus sp. PvR052]|nr:putative ATP-dependent serine protease [Paenibacillus sp. PvR098]MBP2442121.1 putative ATP-dependent serine protease [Paenibacillus sp. PvP052]